MNSDRHEDFGVSDMPRSVRILMAFINRVGFPIVAFLLIFYVCYVSLGRMTEAMMTMQQSISLSNERIRSDYQQIKDSIDRLDVPRRR